MQADREVQEAESVHKTKPEKTLLRAPAFNKPDKAASPATKSPGPKPKAESVDRHAPEAEADVREITEANKIGGADDVFWMMKTAQRPLPLKPKTRPSSLIIHLPGKQNRHSNPMPGKTATQSRKTCPKCVRCLRLRSSNRWRNVQPAWPARSHNLNPFC